MKLRWIRQLRWLWAGIFLTAPGLALSVEFEIWTGPDGTLLLQGTMNQQTRDTLVNAAQTSLGPEKRMVEYIRVDEAKARAQWVGSVAQIIPELIQVNGSLNLKVEENGKITLSGTLDDEGDRERIQTSLRARFPEKDLVIGDLHFQGDIERERALTARLIEVSGGKTGFEALIEFLRSTEIYFDSASVQIGDSDKEKLDVLAAALVRHGPELAEAKVVIQGFTDGKGSQEANEWYRETRCKSVFDYLVQAGVPESALAIAEKEGVPARPTVVEESGESEESTEETTEEVNPRRVAFRIENLDQGALALEDEVQDDEAPAPLPDGISAGDSEVLPDVAVEEAATLEGVGEGASAGEEGQIAEEANGGGAESGGTVAAETPLERLLAESFVEFGAGSTWLNREGRRRLERIAEVMLSAGGADSETWKLEIIGSSDSSGDPEVNAWLRKNRCKSIVNQLIAFGLPTERLVVSAGEDEAPRARVVGAASQAQEADSRRVEFRVLR